MHVCMNLEVFKADVALQAFKPMLHSSNPFELNRRERALRFEATQVLGSEDKPAPGQPLSVKACRPCLLHSFMCFDLTKTLH